MIRGILFFILVTMVTSVSAAYTQSGNEPLPARDISGTILDIPAKNLTFDRFLPPTNSKTDDYYVTTYNKAVQYYNRSQYDNAVPLLEKLSLQYDDDGKTLFLLGNSYLYNKDYENALRTFHYAIDTGYDEKKVNEKIFDTLSGLGDSISKKFDYINAIAWYKTALLYQNQSNGVVKHNIVFCYLQLADQLKKPDNAMVLLYAYDFLQHNPAEDDVLTVVANNLCNYILKPPLYQFFHSTTIKCITDALAEKDDPYLHQCLGFIYLYLNKDSLAKPEFKKVITDYKNSQYYEVCAEMYNDIGIASYRYQETYPLRIDGRPSLKAEIKVQIPQSFAYQTADNFTVTFNHKKVPYLIVSDNYNTKFLSLKISDGFISGINELAVNCDVEVVKMRTSKEILAGFTLADYKKDPRYDRLTGQNQTFDTQDPRIRKMVDEIRQNTKSDRVIDLVAAVYYYVIDLLEYKIVNGPREKVSVKRALANPKTAVCEDYAVLTVTLLRGLGIPASYFSGETYQKPLGHAWTVWYTPDYAPVPLDTTWGDTSGRPDLNFLSASNLCVTKMFGYDSDQMPEGTGISIHTTSEESITARLGTPVVKMVKLNP
jgi:transglutaminase-like putative cysteine protease